MTDVLDQMQLIAVLDELHQARIAPRHCQDLSLCAFAQDTQQRQNDQLRICGFQGDGKTYRFPVAKCILESERFRAVQERLGLLQASVLFGYLRHDAGTQQYTMENLEKNLGLVIKWLRVTPEGPLVPDDREEGMWEVFDALREGEREGGDGLQEFTKLFQFEDLSNTGSSVPHECPGSLLSTEERRTAFALVTDAEQVFFLLLYVLATANRHAAEQLGHVPRARTVREWIEQDDDRHRLRSELCYAHDRLDRAPADEVNREDKRIKRWSGKFYWRSTSFGLAMQALGLLTADSHSTIVPSARYKGLCAWLAQMKCAFDANQPVHPSLCGELYVESETMSRPLVHILFAVRSARINLSSLFPSPECTPDLKAFCLHIMQNLEDVYLPTAIRDVRENRLGLLAGADGVYRYQGIRFNLPGEYLLNKHEVMPRTYFVTPLTFLHDTSHSPPLQIASFALGTVNNIDSTDSECLQKLQAIRSLLRSLAEFGSDQAQMQFLVTHRDNEVRHVLRQAFSHEVKHIGAALTRRWMCKPEPKLRTALDQLPFPPHWARADWAALPFPELIVSAGRLVRFLAFHSNPEDVFASPPQTVGDLAEECWKLARDVCKPRILHNFDINDPRAFDMVYSLLAKVNGLWHGEDLFHVVFDETVKPNWDEPFRDRWMWIGRFLINALLDCIHHASVQKPIQVSAEVRPDLVGPDATTKGVLYLIVRSTKQTSAENCNLEDWLKSFRQKPDTMAGDGRVRGVEVQQAIANSIGGSIERPHGDGVEGGPYETALRVPLVRLLALDTSMEVT